MYNSIMSLVDPRVTKQAEILVDYSLKVLRGENISVIADFEAKPLIFELYKLLIKRGALEVKLHFSSYEFDEIYFKNVSSLQLKHFPKISDFEARNVDCYIRIASSANTRGLSGVDAEAISLRQKVLRPITDYRVEKTRWVVSRFPTEAQAQEADMSLGEYEDFVFSAINAVDWKSLFKKQEKLTKYLSGANKVRIKGPQTDLTLGKADRPAINGGGDHNMPDGEVFTSVVESNANGYITYTYPAIYMGREFQEVYLEFENGKVIKAKASKGEGDLNKILDMDHGARYIGELGIGNNFKITRFTKDILFDEKIGGSIHIALGKGYKETGSKNESGLHWDMIKDLRNGLGSPKRSESGEIWFDEKLVQKNGKWLI